MRLSTIVSVGIIFVAAQVAQAALCADCKDRSYTKDIGTCTKCKDGVTMSGAFKLCIGCSTKLQQCQHCLKPLSAPATKPATRPIDPENDGKYTAGAWEYRYTVSGKGTRSQGYTGELLYNGKPVADAETLNDFYQTPWGPMYWVGRPFLAFGGHGWMLKPKVSAKPGKQLPDPAGGKAPAAGASLRVRVIVPDRQAVANIAPLEPWILEELKTLNVPAATAWSNWEPVTGEYLVLHDSRHYGQLQVRLGKSKDDKTLLADFGGGAEWGVELPRQDGARRVVHCPLQSSIARLDVYLAFKVEMQ